MGKFYVYIKVSTQNIKVNREDIQQVFSQAKVKHPALPPYHSIRKPVKTPSLITNTSDQELSSLEVENKPSAWETT